MVGGVNGPSAPGEEIQNNKEEEEKKEQEEKDKIQAKNDKSLSDKEKKKFSADRIIKYIKYNYRNEHNEIGFIEENQEVMEAWYKTLHEAEYPKSEGKIGDKVFFALERDAGMKPENPIYRNPSLADTDRKNLNSIDDLLNNSESFINKSTNKSKISEESIQSFSKNFYSILMTIAIAISVLIGGILGIKIMISSSEEKAQYKELLVPYVIGCIVVFGAFGIWKFVVNILQNL